MDQMDRFDQISPEDALAWLTSTLASDATDGRGVLPDWVRTIQSGRRVVGYALAVMSPADDNLAVRHVAMGGAGERLDGRVLVVGGLATASAACMGDLIARSLALRGCAGFVTDGLVRDVAALRELPLAVWCRGATPRAPRKEGPVADGGFAICAGVPVADGDLVIADDDGVVVWPQARTADLFVRARERLERDAVRLARILAGGPLDDPTS
jgi:regulator of RNase E activity RraA